MSVVGHCLASGDARLEEECGKFCDVRPMWKAECFNPKLKVVDVVFLFIVKKLLEAKNPLNMNQLICCFTSSVGFQITPITNKPNT